MVKKNIAVLISYGDLSAAISQLWPRRTYVWYFHPLENERDRDCSGKSNEGYRTDLCGGRQRAVPSDAEGEEKEIVAPDAIAGPAGGNASKCVCSIAVQSPKWHKWFQRNVEFNVHKDGHEDDSNGEKNWNIGYVPSHHWGLVEGKVDEQQTCYSSKTS